MRNRKYWIYGLIGCALFGVGDWLLGYVDPGAVAGLKFIIPASSFSNGVDTFCMNAGMMIWFLYLLIKRV